MGEEDLKRVSFEVLSAWDEVVCLGWRENVNLQQVRSTLEMESHEEKIQEIIARVRSNHFISIVIVSVRVQLDRSGSASFAQGGIDEM